MAERISMKNVRQLKGQKIQVWDNNSIIDKPFVLFVSRIGNGMEIVYPIVNAKAKVPIQIPSQTSRMNV